MIELLTNAPVWGIALLVVLGVGLWVSAMRKSDPRLRSGAIGCFAAAVILLGLRYFLPTDQKRVTGETHRLAEAVGKNDWPTVSSLVKDATLFELHGQAVADKLKSLVDQYSLTSLEISSTEARQAQGIITVTLSVKTHHDKSYADTVPSTWDLEWQKRSGVWILTDIRPIRVGTWGPAEAEPLLH